MLILLKNKLSRDKVKVMPRVHHLPNDKVSIQVHSAGVSHDLTHPPISHHGNHRPKVVCRASRIIMCLLRLAEL